MTGACQNERLAARAFCLASAREGRAPGSGVRSAREYLGKEQMQGRGAG